MNKILKIFLISLPILLMIALIPFVTNDYLLTIFYIVIILFSLKRMQTTRTDAIVLLFGFVIMIIFEYFFIKTGVETFTRHSLLGLMPVWLPFLWVYGFVAIKRSVEILDK